MNHIFHITCPDGDVYEVSIRGCSIIRVTRYTIGSSVRQDVDYEHLPLALQEQIFEELIKTLVKNA